MIERCRRKRIGPGIRQGGWVILAALILMAITGIRGAGAQDLQILATEAGLPVTLKGAQSARGLTPFSLTNGAEYSSLVAGGRGFEWRRAWLRWDARGRPVLEDRSRRRAIMGMLLPGGGSLFAGRRLYGLTEFAAVGYLVTESIRASDRVSEKADEVATWKRLYENEANSELRELYRQESVLSYSLWEEAGRHQDREVMIASAFLGLNAIESWWFNRPVSARSRGHQLQLDLPRMSQGRAFLASFVLPGMGQAYRGQKRSAIYLGLWTFLIQEVNDNYYRKMSNNLIYDHRVTQWNADGLDTGEVAELRDLAEQVQDAETNLHLFTALAGGLWIANLMDVAFTSPEGSRTRGKTVGLTLLPSPTGSMGLGWAARF